ncbi:type II secretion system protein [Puniceicoccus vermicola]|uniref:DUF1559 domain-containing protein n=1 Tax=Puniceicoccus vermicola TaxID=388746 RepID=A0A7X1AWI5_9BACT|nr:DUF1559 domain-containing protein [Puniceicoccus vermicola]MBC2601142.1 DUF1559 domain-containing protein [Puniceicoccus vermicola]
MSPLPTNRSQTRPSTAGFSIIELLTGIAVIAILFGITLATIDNVRKRANSTQCQSNLRQIGLAVLSFANENDGQLPGKRINSGQAGLSASQPAYVSINSWNRLATHLAPYLGYTLPDDGSAVLCKEFLCPGVARQYPELANDPYAAIYVANPHNVLPGNPNSRPFGNASGSRTSSLNLHAIPDPTNTYMLSDIDKESSGAGKWTSEAETPVHGDYRNQVFFDGSVRQAPLSDPL